MLLIAYKCFILLNESPDWVSFMPSRSALCDPEAFGWPLQHLLCIRSHQTQPAYPQSSHQPGHCGSHLLHVLAAFLLCAPIRYPTTSLTPLSQFTHLLKNWLCNISISCNLTFTFQVQRIPLPSSPSCPCSLPFLSPSSACALGNNLTNQQATRSARRTPLKSSLQKH